jgi:hypothetical protein
VTRRELKARLRAQRAALRAELDRRRAAVRARTGSRDNAQRRRWIALAILAILLLLLLRDCSCATGPGLLTEFPIGTGREAPASAAAPTVPFTGRVATRPRPAMTTEGVAPPPWLTSLRIQVAARSPRLAECFEGTTRPGTLRWSVAVDADHGVVSDAEIEPTLAGQELSTTQRRCALGVLADPSYRLATGDGPATPARVTLVIEF